MTVNWSFHRMAWVCIALAMCGFAFGGELQPVEAGVAPLRIRLAEVKNESASLRTTLVVAEPSERARVEQQLDTLEKEAKQLAAEIESAEKQSRSPYITYAVPAPHETR